MICLIDRKCLIPPSLVPWSFSELTDCSAIKWIYWVFDQDINPSLNSDEIIQPELIDSVTDTLIALRTCIRASDAVFLSILDYRSHRCVIPESL